MAGRKPAKGARSGRARRSKGESFTGAKENKAEVRKAGSFDQIEIVIADKDFTFHFKNAKEAKRRMDEAQGHYRAQLKAAKEVGPDVLDAVKLALQWGDKSAADTKRRLELLGYALKQVGGPIQLSVLDSLAKDVIEDAEARGYDDAKAGESQRRRYPENSDLSKLYDLGFMKGTIENLPITDEAKAASLAEYIAENGPFPLPGHNSQGDATDSADDVDSDSAVAA